MTTVHTLPAIRRECTRGPRVGAPAAARARACACVRVCACKREYLKGNMIVNAGPWRPSTIENPHFKWAPTMIANPAYQPPSFFEALRVEVSKALPWVTLGVLVTVLLEASQLPVHRLAASVHACIAACARGIAAPHAQAR